MRSKFQVDQFNHSGDTAVHENWFVYEMFMKSRKSKMKLIVWETIPIVFIDCYNI